MTADKYNYKTLIELFPADLDVEVKKHLNGGWNLHGSPYVSFVLNDDVPGTYQSFHCQAITFNVS